MKKFEVIVLAVVLCTVLLAGCAVPVPVPLAAETQTPSAKPEPVGIRKRVALAERIGRAACSGEFGCGRNGLYVVDRRRLERRDR